MTVAQLVSRERSKLRLAMVVRGVAIALAAAALIVAAGTVALGHSRWITHPTAPLLSWAVVAAAAAVAIWWTGRAIHRGATRTALATEIERERSLRAGSLRGAMEVAQSGALGRRAADEVGRRLAAGRGALAPGLQHRAWRRGIVAAIGAGAAVLLFGAARRAAPDGWRVLRHPVGAFTGAILPPLTITDIPSSVLRGERLRVRVLAPERRELRLRLRTTGAAWITRTLPVMGGRATAVIGPLDADVMLVASDGRTTSDTVLVRVTDRPFVGDVAIRAIYPAYLNRAPETLPAGEPARVPRGTALAIQGRASVELTHIALARGADTVRLTPDGHVFSGRLEASEGGRWLWNAVGVEGPIPDLPAPLELDVLPDSAPQVEILAPERDTVVLANARLVLRAAVSDDHGIRSVLLRSWRTRPDGAAMPEVAQSLAAPGVPQWSGGVDVDLAPRSLQPGDALHLVVSATDDSPWRQRGSSREIVLHVPSLQQQRELARTMADSTAARAVAAAQAEQELAERTEAAAHSRTDRSTGTSAGGRSGQQRTAQAHSMSYQSAEQATALAKEQQALQQRVRSLQNDAHALERQLRSAGAMDSVLQKQLRDAQSLLQQALTPELQRQLDDLMKATQQLSQKDARAALQNLAQQQQRLREALERSAEMLKRAAMEGSMQTLRDDAREIATREHQVADSLSHGDSSAARQSAPLSERSRDLSRQIKQLAERLKQAQAQSGPQKLQSAAQRAEQSARAMQQAATRADSDQQAAGKQAQGKQAQGKQAQGKQAQGKQQQGQQQQQQRGQQQGQQRGQKGQQQGQKQQGQQQGQQGQQKTQGQQGTGQQRQGQAQQREGGQASQRAASAAAREAAQQMDQAAQQLSDARASQIQEWKNQLTSDLDQSIQETLQLARKQKELAERARSGKPDAALRGDQSAVQQGINKVGERLEKAARKTSNISPQSQSSVANARQRVQDATQQVAAAKGRDSQQAAQAMDQASQALTKAAADLARDRTQVGNAKSASGFDEMLQRMRDAAKEQGSLNAQAAGLMPMPGTQPGAQMLAQARALAQRQRALAEKLDGAGSGEAAQRAAELAKEMRQIASRLQTGRVDQSLLDRQQQLFHRLLDAGLSLQKDEREDTGKRESQSATGREGVITPGTTASGRSAVRYRTPDWSELRGLSVEERRAVLEYFKRINAGYP